MNVITYLKHCLVSHILTKNNSLSGWAATQRWSIMEAFELLEQFCKFILIQFLHIQEHKYGLLKIMGAHYETNQTTMMNKWAQPNNNNQIMTFVI